MRERNESLPDRYIMEAFDAIKRLDKDGTEYWLGRELQPRLGYTKWDNFADAINKAKLACESVGANPRHHFADVRKKVALGLGTQRSQRDIALTRYAVYLTAMNGDPAKPEIAAAQVYFAVQTHRQEQADAMSQDEVRVELRHRIKEDVKALNSAAKAAGVKEYGLFHDAGYRGLYGGLGLTQIKEQKGLGTSEQLFDRAGRAELAANDFRITQTEDKIHRDNVKGEILARKTHHDVGHEVRQTIEKLGGTMPENMKPEPSIKKQIRSSRKRRMLPEDH